MPGLTSSTLIYRCGSHKASMLACLLPAAPNRLADMPRQTAIPTQIPEAPFRAARVSGIPSIPNVRAHSKNGNPKLYRRQSCIARQKAFCYHDRLSFQWPDNSGRGLGIWTRRTIMKSDHRHELKTNELADWMAHTPEWGHQNRNSIIGVAAPGLGGFAVYFLR